MILILKAIHMRSMRGKSANVRLLHYQNIVYAFSFTLQRYFEVLPLLLSFFQHLEN